MSPVTIPLLSFLCLLCLVGHSQAGLNNMTARDVDMNNLKQLMLTEIRRDIQSLIRGRSADITYEVRNFQLTDFVPPKSYLTLRRRYPPTYEWIGFNAQVYGVFDWFYDYRTWWIQQSNRGVASVAITRIGFSVYVTRERGFIRAGFCTSRRPSVSIRSRDYGLNRLDYYVIQLLEDEIERLLSGSNGLICAYVRRFIERQGRTVSGMIDGIFGGIDITGGSKDITNGGKNITGGGTDITGERKVITGGRKDITSGRKYITGGGKDITGGGKDITGGGKDITGGGKNTTGGGKYITGGGKNITGGGKDITGGRKVITRGRKVISGGRKDITGEGKDITGGGKDITSGGKDITIGGDNSDDGYYD